MNEKITRIINAMKENQIPQLLIADPMSVCYLTGRYITCMERMMVLYLSLESRPKMVVGKLFPQPEEDGLEVVYFEDDENPVEVLASLMQKGTIIGVDKIWPAKFLLPLMQTGFGTEYVDGSFIIDRVRQIKTREEQEKMIAVSKKNDLGMERIIPLVSAGYTELEMGEKLLEIYHELGTEGHSFEPIIAYGAHAADPHHEPDNSCGQVGDAIVIDIGCKMDGYCADMTRTVFIGEVSREAEDIYEIVKEANRRGREAVRPGARFCDIDAAARDYIKGQGYGEYFTHRLGHNIGMEVHEWGDVSGTNREFIRPGMCFSIEPGIYVPGVAGVRIEDLVLVTEDGCKVLNNFSRDLTIIK